MLGALSLEIVSSARIDGAREFYTFNRIVLPIMKPAMATQAIFAFVTSWNNYFMPAILCSIIIGLLFNSILHPKGLLNSFLSDTGLGFLKQNWLTDTKIVMYTISGVEIWQWSGFHMAIYLAGLQGVPSDLRESMLIDGANGWQRFRYLTFPFILPSFNINLITSLIGGFKVFDMVFLLTNGGPGFASQVVGVQIYKAFGDGFWGLGTAYSVLQFAVIMILSMTILSYLRTKEIEA